MPANRAVVVDPEAPGRLVIQPVAEPVTDRGEALVRVRAISLNRGEVRRSGMAAHRRGLSALQRGARRPKSAEPPRDR